jgi:hypothetical protein
MRRTARPMTRPSKADSGRTLLPLLIAALLAASSARAELASVSGGVGVAVPLGEYYITYAKSTSFHLEVVDRELGFSQYFSPVFSAKYVPMSVQNAAGPMLKVNLWTFLAGLQFRTPSTGDPLHTFLSAQAGFTYDTLSFGSSSGNVPNTSCLFTLRLHPGVDVPLSFVWDRLSLELSSPIDLLFSSTPLILLGGVGSLRFKL